MALIVILSIFLIIFLFINRKTIRRFWKKACAYFLGSMLIGFAYWTQLYIGKTNFQALLSTLLIQTEGLFEVSFLFIKSFYIDVIVIPLIITTIILWIDAYIDKKQLILFYRSVFSKLLGSLLIIVGLCWINDLYNVSEGVLNISLGLNYQGVDEFAEAYSKPEKQHFVFSAKPKNLIFIYIESLDLGFNNEKVFKKNLLKSLEDIPHMSFEHFVQTVGADYTIAGMIASQCGIPLNLIAVLARNNLDEVLNSFLPQTMCLGDILHQAGYYNVFMKGASLTFSGTGNFYKLHHYDEVSGKMEWMSKKSYSYHDMLGWGLPDDLLFKEAKIKVTELMKKDKPFNLTLLTVDTHGPYGQFNATCRKKGAQSYEDIVTCVSDEIADFLQFIKEKGWSDQMTVVVIGDHLSIMNPVINKLSQIPIRYVFNMFIDNSLPKKQRELILHEDLFPTILNALHITWGTGHLALGYSPFEPYPPKLTGKEHIDTINKLATQPSPTYRNLWFPSE